MDLRAPRFAPAGIPPEIWYLILIFLKPDRPHTWQYGRPTEPGTPWKLVGKREQWATWRKHRQSLVSVSQTSKAMATLTRPLLYRTVVLVSRRGLASLLDLLVHQPYLGEYVRELYCLFRVPMDVERLAERPDEQGYSTGESGEVGDRRQALSEYAIFEQILANTPKATELMLLFPVGVASMTDLSLRFDYLLDPVSYQSPVQGFDCKRLKSLYLRPDLRKKSPKRDIEARQAFMCDIIQYLPYLISLETLEMSTEMERTLEQPGFETWLKSASVGDAFEHPSLHLPQLRHLCLYSSRIREEELIGLCLACTNLETLLVEFEKGYSELNHRRLPPGRTLNDALLLRANTLRSLELLGSIGAHFLTPEENEESSKLRRLSCVPKLVNLRHLSLDFRSIYGRPDFLTPADVANLASYFPPSLRSLEIVCEFSWAYPAEHELDWDDTALTISGLVTLHRKELLPRQLDHLILAMTPPSQRYSNGDPCVAALEQARSYFDTTATKFRTIQPPARHISVFPDHCESDEDWIERRADENDRRLLLRVAGHQPPLYEER